MVLWIGTALAGPPGLLSVATERVELDARGLAASPEGDVVAFGKDVVVRLGSDVPPLELDGADITAVDVSSGGWIVVASNGSVTLHGPDNREMLRLGGTGVLASVAISPDGTRLALASAAGVALHDASDGRMIWSIPGQSGGVTFHPDGKRVIAGVPGGNVVLATKNGEVQTKFGDTPAVWFSWTSDRLWTRGWEAAPQSWDPVTFAPAEAPTLEGAINSAAVHPTDGWLIVDGCVVGGALCPAEGAAHARFDGTGALWVATGGQLARWFLPPEGTVRALGEVSDRPLVTALAADGTDWVVARIDGVLQRLGPDGSTRFEVRVGACGDRDCVPIAAGGDGGGLWVIGPQGLAMTWAPGGEPLDKKARPTGAVSAGRLADGRWVVLGTDDRVRVGTKPGKGSATAAVAGARFVAVGGDAFVIVGDAVQAFAADGTPLATPKLGPGLTAVAAAVSPDGGSVALVDSQGALHAYAMSDGRAAFRQPYGLATDGVSLAWSADGERLVTGGPGGVQVFSGRDGAPVLEAVLAPGGGARLVAPGPEGVGLVQGASEAEQVLVLDAAGLIP